MEEGRKKLAELRLKGTSDSNTVNPFNFSLHNDFLFQVLMQILSTMTIYCYLFLKYSILFNLL